MSSRRSNRYPKRLLARLEPSWAALALASLVLGGAALWPARPTPLPDFAAIEEIPARKQAFFEFLAPIVRDENRRVLAQRERLLELLARVERGQEPGWLDRHWLKRLSADYDVAWDPARPLAEAETLKRRVDVVPVALALVQAATESGWGRSRFAVEGNNLFGHWCYRQGCGLVPARRSGGAAHEVAAFESVRQSVARYLHNLNTHDAYEPLRRIRASMRAADRRPEAVAMAEGLERYSERRGAYVDEIKTVIRVNRPILDRVGAAL